MKKCPYCAKENQDGVANCKYCGRGLKDNSARNIILSVVGIVAFFWMLNYFSQSGPSNPAPTARAAQVAAPTSTKKPRPTSTPTPISLLASVTHSTIWIRKGPGTQHERIDGLGSGTCMQIVGRNTDASWVYMLSDDNKTGWVAADLLTIEGNVARVSVRASSEVSSFAPTAKIQPTATQKPVIFFTSTPRPVVIQPTAQNNNCSPAYPGVCIPPRPPDLDCRDVPHRRFTVLSPDPHGFDADGDGIGCET